MKKIIVTTLVGLVAAVSVYAQGTVSYVNYSSSPALNAKVFLSDGSTAVPTSGYTALMIYGTSAGSLTGVATGNASFVAAGIFSGASQALTSPAIAGGATAWIQIEVWSTAYANFGLAQAAGSANANVWGLSNIFSVTTGNPNATPPGTPATLIGLNSFNLNSVPEPSTIALAGLGLGSLLLFRRRK